MKHILFTCHLVNALYFFFYCRFLIFFGIFTMKSRNGDKLNSKNWILMFNFVFENKKKNIVELLASWIYRI